MNLRTKATNQNQTEMGESGNVQTDECGSFGKWRNQILK